MQQLKLFSFLLFLFVTSNTIAATTDKAQKQALPEPVKKALHLMFGPGGIKGLAIQKLPDSDLYEIVDNKKIEVFYISASGRYLLQGDSVYDISKQGLDITEKRRNTLRLTSMKSVKNKDLITFKSEEKTKHVVSVFTDVDCFYCSKLHREIDNYNDAGIEIRYLGFPRAGLKSPTYKKMVSVWCAEDQHKAMTDAKAGLPVDESDCKTNIPEQYELGQKIGVTGTPALLLPDGELVPGYIPADRLLKYLEKPKQTK